MYDIHPRYTIAVLSVFCFMVSLVKLEGEVNVNKEFEKDINSTPGLQKDNYVFGFCNFTGNKTPLKLYKKQVEAAKICNDIPDYRCNKACQYEKIGISDAGGNVNKTRFETHLNLFMAGQDKIATQRVVDASLACLNSTDGTKAMLSTTNCSINDRPMACVVVAYYKICRLGNPLPKGFTAP